LHIACHGVARRAFISSLQAIFSNLSYNLKSQTFESTSLPLKGKQAFRL